MQLVDGDSEVFRMSLLIFAHIPRLNLLAFLNGTSNERLVAVGTGGTLVVRMLHFEFFGLLM